MTLVQNWVGDKDYCEDIYHYLGWKENERPKFFGRVNCEYRQYSLWKIKQLIGENKLSVTVKYLAIYLFDYYLDSNDADLDLLIVCCLSVAAKVDEIDSNIPKLSKLMTKKGKFELRQAIQMEWAILNFFKWDLLVPTPATFVDYFSDQVFGKDEQKYFKDVQLLLDIKKWLLKYLDETLDKVQFYNFAPSLVTASCLFCAKHQLKCKPVWTKHLINVTGYSSFNLKGCLLLLLERRNGK